MIESLRRLYAAGSVSDSKLSTMVSEGKITSEEKAYITNSSTADEYRKYYNMVNPTILGGAS